MTACKRTKFAEDCLASPIKCTAEQLTQFLWQVESKPVCIFKLLKKIKNFLKSHILSLYVILTTTVVETYQQFNIIGFKETGVISVSGTSTKIVFRGRKWTPVFTVIGAEEFPQLLIVHVRHF